VMVWLRDNLRDAMLASAGNYAPGSTASFVSAASPSTSRRPRLDGLRRPAAVAMKRLYPERTVICIAGDGDF